MSEIFVRLEMAVFLFDLYGINLLFVLGAFLGFLFNAYTCMKDDLAALVCTLYVTFNRL